MEAPLSQLLLLSIGLLFTIFAGFVESQPFDTRPPPPLPPPSPPLPLAPSGPPPPSSHALPPFHPRPSTKHHENTTNDNRWRPRPPPSHSHNHKLNTGKKLGLLFVGIVISLQIGVVGLLVFKRRQLLKVKGTYETCSSSS